MMIITQQPAEISQTEYSRWGNPVKTRQTTFAGRVVTHQGLDAQPAPTKLTSNVLNLNNAFTPVSSVMEFLNAQG